MPSMPRNRYIFSYSVGTEKPATYRQPGPVPGDTWYVGDVMPLLRRYIKYNEAIGGGLDLGTGVIFPDNVQPTAIIGLPSR